LTQITGKQAGLGCLLCALTLLVGSLSGCHRGYYRRMADAETKKLVDEKNNDPRWAIPDGAIDVDPYSRMFDPFSLDHPPLPPDDPTSHEFMERVDGRRGYPHWRANGETRYVENPEWLDFLPMDAQGRLVLNLDTSVELSQIHSDNLQRQKEELYLSALDVTLQRFGFDSQLFAGFNSFYGTTGRFRDGGSTTFSNQFGANGGGINYRKLGITGANFAVGLANTILWNFSGPTTQTANSLINFSITQPLMRGAGRARIMESLTQTERDLLGNVRAMERFRQGFYLEIVAGRNAGPGPSRGGNFLANPTAATIGVGGFLGLLQNQQQIRFAELNVLQQSNSLIRLRELFSAQQIDYLQLQQQQISLYQSQQNLLNQRVNYENAVDRFKIALGLPPDIEVVIEDDSLAQFTLISDELLGLQNDLNALRLDYGDSAGGVNIKLREILDDLETARLVDPENLPTLQLPDTIPDDVRALVPYIEQSLEKIAAIKKDVVNQIQDDFEVLERVSPKRIEYLRKLRSKIESGELPADIDVSAISDDSIVELKALEDRLELVLKAFVTIEERLRIVAETINSVDELPRQANQLRAFEVVMEDIIAEVAAQLTQLSNNLTELSLIQVLARSNSIELKDVDLRPDEATEIARCFRLDWMNARAGLVDSWRQIQFAANALESQFDLVLDGSIGNVGDNPFRVRYENGSLRGGFRFDSPIVRLAERNQYRQTLINYQRARRRFYQFEDEVKRNLRQVLRTIDLQKTSFELQKLNLEQSILNLEQANLVLEQPPRFQAGGLRSQGLGPTTARDLNTAINQVNSAQIGFLNAWLTYEVLRLNLDYDLGTIQVDPTGRWIDPEIIDREIGYRVAAIMGLDTSCLDMNLPFREGQPMNSESVAPRAPTNPLFPTEPSFEPDPEIEFPTSSRRSSPSENRDSGSLRNTPTGTMPSSRTPGTPSNSNILDKAAETPRFGSLPRNR
jgi:hypothetical protein